MPRGIPKKRRRRSNGEAETAEGVEVDENGNEVVSGENEPAPSLGEAIEIVRSALSHFDDPTRKRVVRAANMLLK